MEDKLDMIEHCTENESDFTIPYIIEKCEKRGVQGASIVFQKRESNKVYAVSIFFQKLSIDKSDEVEA